MSGFTAVDLSQLPAPSIVEELDFETLFAAMLADLQARDVSYNALVEGDPAFIILEAAAYRELLIRQRVNEAARAVMLAYAQGADLENLGALSNVEPLILDPGDEAAFPPIPPTKEDDDDYRRRIQLAPEGISTAGPEGAYIFHALSADGDVLDVAATSPAPGEVVISVLSQIGDGTASAELIETVDTKLSDEGLRPLTDEVTVQSATIVNYSLEATILFKSGPDSAVVMASVQTAVDVYIAAHHALGVDVTLSGIYAALHQAGVQNAVLAAPVADLAIDADSAAFCTSVTLTDGGVNE